MPGRPANRAGSRARSADRLHAASRIPAAPPAAAMTRLSVSICCTSRPLDAPTAVRIETSFCRAAARASSSVATFAHAISSTNADRAEHDQQHRLHVADERVAQRPQVRKVVGVLRRELLRQPRADHPQILTRALRRHAVPQPPDRLEEMRRPQRAIVVVQRERHDDVRTRRPPEPRRQHADDLERTAVERDRTADHRRVGAEAMPPQRVAQQHDAMAADGFLLGAKIAAERRRDAQHAEERRRHLERMDPFRLARRRSGCRRWPPASAGRPRSPRTTGSPAASRSSRPARPARTIALARTLLGERHHAIGARVRQRPPQHGVDDAEDRGAGADAEREREDRDRGKAGLASQHPHAEGDVLAEARPTSCPSPSTRLRLAEAAGRARRAPIGT